VPDRGQVPRRQGSRAEHVHEGHQLLRGRNLYRSVPRPQAADVTICSTWPILSNVETLNRRGFPQVEKGA
jgi:hypothetical protein